jgi:hypothetical protein
MDLPKKCDFDFPNKLKFYNFKQIYISFSKNFKLVQITLCFESRKQGKYQGNPHNAKSVE